MINWPHSPPHRLTEQGAYMVTCGTYQKAHFLNTAEKLDFFQNLFFDCLTENRWELHAWAALSNHYHFMASSPDDPETLKRMLSKLQTLSARELNLRDRQTGRKIWYQYFDTHITFERSYLARLKYIHQNPARHGVVACAENNPLTPTGKSTLQNLKKKALSGNLRRTELRAYQRKQDQGRDSLKSFLAGELFGFTRARLCPILPADAARCGLRPGRSRPPRC